MESMSSEMSIFLIFIILHNFILENGNKIEKNRYSILGQDLLLLKEWCEELLRAKAINKPYLWEQYKCSTWEEYASLVLPNPDPYRGFNRYEEEYIVTLFILFKELEGLNLKKYYNYTFKNGDWII